MTYIDGHGYVRVLEKNHPFATQRGLVRQHRLVWEEHNNAILLPWVDVHHINGNKQDNRIQNLQIMTRSEHLRQHMIGNTNGKIEMDGRICSTCKSNHTAVQKTKGMGLRPAWRIGPLTDQMICKNCYENERRWKQNGV
jgi:HNH endonuclease